MIESLYIHIPFCNNICYYCDFCKMYYNKKYVKEYLYALKKEINKYYKNDILKTIYIGGGTPSSLSIDELKLLFSIVDKLNIASDYEMTFECNINDINKELLIFLKNNKVNRLSIGIESFNDNVLKILGRNNSDVVSRIKQCKKYFSNINIDLIYGVNCESINDLKKDLKSFLDLNVPHISIYSLILEDNTILKVNNYKEQSDEILRDMYDLICSTLKNNGYNHYEISSFSKEGYSSNHNLTYWNNNKYYGFGLGSSGFIRNIRYNNTRSITNYINGNYRLDEEIITKKIDMENFMILGLRKTDGVSNSEFKKRYNTNIEDVFDTKNLVKYNDRYYIKEDDLFVSNYILCDFIE